MLVLSSSPALFIGSSLPSIAAIAFVTEKAFNGDLSTNPYNFKRDFGGSCIVEEVSLKINGNDLDGLDEPFAKNCQENQYMRFISYSNQREANYTNGISLEKFLSGYFFSIHDLTSSGKGSQIFSNPVVRSGNVR